MLPRLFAWMTLAIAGFLAVGCQRPHPRSSALQSPVTASVSGRSTPNPDAPLDRLAIEAHARYAAAITRALNQDPGALDDFAAAAMADPSNETLVMGVSLDLIHAGKSDQALDLLKRATEQGNSSGDVFARLGMVYIQLKQFDKAIEVSQLAIKKDPLSLAGYQNLLLIYSRNKQAKEASTLLNKAVGISTNDPEFLIGLGELFVGFGTEFPAEKRDADLRAGDLFQRALKSFPRDPELQLRLADGLNAVGKADQAAELYLTLLNSLPDVPLIRESVRAKLEQIYPRIKDPRKATELLETFVRENPTDPRAYVLLGAMAESATNYAKAAEYFSKAIVLNPDFEQVYGDLAGVQLAQDKTFEAKATLDLGMKKFPRSFVLEYLSGLVDTRLKDYTNAVKHFTSAEIIAKATRPEVLKDFFYFQFGAACERIGDYAQSERYFLKCLDLSPNFDEALNYLGYMWADQGTNLDRAHEFIERALKSEPKNPAYLDSMAWVLYKLKRPKEALDYALKAVANSPEPDGELYSHLAAIYEALGETPKAQEARRKSASIKPEPD